MWLVDLFNREIIGYSSGPNKDAELVKKAFSTVQTNLSQIKIFHTDRGNEFKNKIIDEILEVFEIERSLSMKGCPYDNAVAEATDKVIKTEFVNHQIFETQEQLGYEFADYVNWYNNHRIHSSLGIHPQLNIVKIPLKKLFSLVLTIHLIEGLWKWLKQSVIHNVFYKNINEIRNAVQGFIQHINERPSEVIQRLCEKCEKLICFYIYTIIILKYKHKKYKCKGVVNMRKEVIFN